MDQALKIIQFDNDEKAPINNVQPETKKELKKIVLPNLKTLKIAAIFTAIIGIVSLVLEVQYYFQFRYEIYIARLIPTLFSFITLLLIQSDIGKKHKVLITHTYLFIIIGSISYVTSRIPSLYLYNSIALLMFVLTLSLFLLWELKNQIILSGYIVLSLFISAYFGNLIDFYDANTYVFMTTVLIVLTLAGISNYLLINNPKEFISKNNLTNGVLDENSSDLNELLNSTTAAFFQISKDGEIKYSNSSFNKLIGNKDSSEVNFFNDFIKNENVKNHIIKKIENKGRIENYRINALNGNNKNIVVLMDCKLKSNDSDIFIEGWLKDLTKQFEKENLLTKEIEVLKKANKNKYNIFNDNTGKEKKKNLISKMGHELRTPMNSVLGFLTLIENGLFESEDELKDFSRNAKQSAESLLNLMNDIVEISKIDDGSIDIEEIEFNLKDEIEKVISVVSQTAKQKDLKVNCDISENIPDTIITDPTKYSQILTNLVNYSISTTDSGEIKIFVSEEQNKNGYTQIVTSLLDNSANEQINKIKEILDEDFNNDVNEPKVTTSTLHLMICKALTDLMDGSITFEEKSNGGKYTVKIPAGNSKVEQESTISIEPNNNLDVKQNIGRKPKLLLVEDNPISRKVEKKLLEETGYNIECVDNGFDALEKIKNGNYDLILMDIELKEMSGLEVTKNIRNLPDGLNNIPIIAVTAHSSMKDREKCLLAGMNDYISKPINITFLKMTIDQWLNAVRVN